MNRTTLIVNEPVDEGIGRAIQLTIMFHPGYPGFISGAPEDCYPSEPPTIEILDAIYLDTSEKVNDNVVERFDCDELLEALKNR